MSNVPFAIVPAGGRSRRMGRLVDTGGKGALRAGPGGRPLLAGVCETLAGLMPRVIVVAAAGQPLPSLPPAVEVIRDRRPGAGPLAAIADGLRHVAGSGAGPTRAVIASCDLPRLNPAVVELLLAEVARPEVRWAVPEVGGHRQVLLSAMRTDLEAEIMAAVAAGKASPRRLLEAVIRSAAGSVRLIPEAAVASVDPGLASFADIDTPEDLAGLDEAAPS